MGRKKIALIGAGQIGGTLALLAAQRKLGDIVLFDIFEGMARGKALDLTQMASLMDSWGKIEGVGHYKAIAGADVCIVTAGFPRKPGMSRDDLFEKNLIVVTQVALGIKRYAPDSFIIVVTNPLDVMVYALSKIGGFPKKKVVGMAGVLDSARFRTFLSLELDISTEDIHTFVLGGHGDDMVPLLNFSNVGGISLSTLVKIGMLSQDKLDKIVDRTRTGGAEIVKLFGNGSAFYTPALSAIDMAESYLYNKRRIMPCACWVEGEYGVSDVFVGVPAIIGENGIEKIIEIPLTNLEKRSFLNSVESVKDVVNEMHKIKIYQDNVFKY